MLHASSFKRSVIAVVIVFCIAVLLTFFWSKNSVSLRSAQNPWLTGSLTKVGTSGGVDVISVDFSDQDTQTLVANKMYLVHTPSTFTAIPFDVAFGQHTNYFGYQYSDANATQEIQHRGASSFLQKFPSGKFFASTKARGEDSAHGNGLITFEERNGMHFHSTDDGSGGVLLEPSALYVLIINDPQATINLHPAPVCGDGWKAGTEECDAGSLNGSGSEICTMECKIPPPQLPDRPAGSFTDIGDYKGKGGTLAQIIGPGPTPDSERLYVSYYYEGSIGDVVSIDPDTGNYDVYTFPNSNAAGAWAMTVGSDHKIYIGTVGKAELYRIDPVAKKLEYIGRPSTTEAYIWQLTAGPDGKIYGCTYPNAKLVRYDPVANKLEDLGRMSATESYARFIAADSGSFVYTTVGSVHTNLVAYNIATGEHRELLTDTSKIATFNIHETQGPDGSVYASVGTSTGSVYWLHLNGWNAIPVATSSVPNTLQHPAVLLQDGRRIKSTVDGKIVLHTATNGDVTHSYAYPGKDLIVFRLVWGPDNKIYGSSELPMNLVRFDPSATGSGGVRIDTDVSPIGAGETYSFLTYNKFLYIASYSALANMLAYDPSLSYAPGSKADSNPYILPVLPEVTTHTWRPMAMIAASDRIFVGSVPEYGKLGGYLTEIDPQTQKETSATQVIPNQSVISLTALNTLIVGGTDVRGGGGSVSTATGAHLFGWDPINHQLTFDVLPVPHQISITDLATTPDGHIIGFAGTTFFVFDPQTKTVIHTADVPFTILINSIALGPDGLFYGLTSGGIFTIDPATYQVSLKATYAPGVTGGFALWGNSIFFASYSHVVEYRIR